jgi:integrase
MPAALRVYTEETADRQPSPGRIDEVRDVVDLYVKHLHARHGADDYSAEAIDAALPVLRKFRAEFGLLGLDHCKQHDLTQFFERNPQWKKASMRKRAASTILSCFRWCAEEELIEKCPYKMPKFLKGQPDKARRPATTQEYVTLMRHGSQALRRSLFILRRVGIRTKEMRNLIWPDIDLGPIPHISLNKHKTVKKSGRARKVGLDNATANFLRALRRNQRGKTQHVFTNSCGKPWTRHSFARHLRRYAKKLGIDEGVAERVSGYCWRHSYTLDGIEGEEGGVTTRRIADQLGHSRTNMIDAFYGRQSRENVAHLNEVQTEMLRKRKRQKKAAKKPPPRKDGFHQPWLFKVPPDG